MRCGIPTISKPSAQCRDEPSGYTTTSIGLPDDVGRLVNAAAHTMQRANSIGPGERWLDNAILFWLRTATARATCSANCVDPSCHNNFSFIMFLTDGVNFNISP